MIVGDNVALFVPYETRSRPLWNFKNIQSKRILPNP